MTGIHSDLDPGNSGCQCWAAPGSPSPGHRNSVLGTSKINRQKETPCKAGGGGGSNNRSQLSLMHHAHTTSWIHEACRCGMNLDTCAHVRQNTTAGASMDTDGSSEYTRDVVVVMPGKGQEILSAQHSHVSGCAVFGVWCSAGRKRWRVRS